MAIIYYPNRIQKKTPPAIDRVMAQRRPQLVRGASNVASTALDVVVSANTDWQLNSIKFTFDNANPRDYSAKILGGRKVVTDLNDYLWFQSGLTLPQKITLDAGFYTGDQLAVELKDKLDNNTEFNADGVTFTVTYDAATGLFTITPSSGTIRYLNVNTMQTQRYRDSIAGHLFGLTADTAFGASVTSNETVFGLNQEAWVVDETGSAVEEDFFDDLKILDIDQAVHIEVSTAPLRVDYEVNYEEIV